MKLNQKLIIQSNFPTKVVVSHIDFDKYISIDLSHQNTKLKKIKLNSSESFSEYINNYLKIHSKKLLLGGIWRKERFTIEVHILILKTLKINVIFIWESTFGVRPTQRLWRL